MEVDMHDILLNSTESPQEEYIQDFASALILPREKSLPRWSALPRTVLEIVYSHLDRKDRSQMSLVCRKWNQEYSAPSLWRTMKVIFPQTFRSGNACQAVRFAQLYGYAFRHVEIRVNKRIDFCNVNVVEKQLTEFLEVLTSFSQLSSISFTDMYPYINYLPVEEVCDIFPKIKVFLLSQNKIETIRFHNTYLTILEALEVIKGIFGKDRENLKHLALREFLDSCSPFYALLFDEYASQLPPMYDILMNLKSIEIDYSPIFECLITSCFEYGISTELSNKLGILEEMTINHSSVEQNNLRGISADAWKYFFKKFPSLKIKFHYNSMYDKEYRFETIIEKMPVKILEFVHEVDGRLYAGTSIGHLFSHLVLCKINIFLEEMSVIWKVNVRMFASDLIYFLQTCSRLSKLHLYLEHPVQELDVVFNNVLNNRPPALEKISITVGDIPTEHEKSYYLHIADYFAPLLLIKNIKLFLDTEMAESLWLR